MDLSKDFDTLNYDFLIAKLHAYGFDIKTLKLFHKKVAKNKMVRAATRRPSGFCF